MQHKYLTTAKKLHLMLELNEIIDTCLFHCCFLITALDLEIHSKAEFLAVRMDFDIPPEEKEFVMKRKVVVAQATQKLLGLESEPQLETVVSPVFSIII